MIKLKKQRRKKETDHLIMEATGHAIAQREWIQPTFGTLHKAALGCQWLAF